MILLAGVLNLLAFTLYATGLKFTTAVRANLMNAAQTALAAVGGWLVFREPLNAAVVAGIVLTIVGIVAGRPPGKRKRRRCGCVNIGVRGQGLGTSNFLSCP